ncbi:Hypothetical predicted protein [Olea europaea subsp. europaea]|uniref:Uncharacterized protein n=1 Tax=Olea europaea subsp. europaea TaxID=158383 RepID=A0A8S0SGE3_OLEEU|nr:Hypothetical predicted protein [Olea europaea subsp. europaea]
MLSLIQLQAKNISQSILYSGCPFAAKLSSIWSLFSADCLSCNPGIGSTSQEKEDLSLYFPSLPPMLYSITEAAMDPMASDVEKFSGKRSLNSLNEKDFLASQTKVKQMAFSNPVSGDPVTSCQTGPNTCLPRKALSTCSLSFSGLTGESSTEDHHEWDVFYAYNG